MQLTLRQFARLAEHIRSELLKQKELRQRQNQETVDHFLQGLQRVRLLQHQLAVCHTRGLSRAAEKLSQDLRGALEEIPYRQQDVTQAVQTGQLKTPSLRDIYREIAQTEDEFSELRYDREQDYLAVTTEPIELEGVYLGEFEIQLHLAELEDLRYMSCCRVVALNPNPAAANESVTHPHVKDECLCPGEARAAIHNALSDGRICDFFLLVRAVLTHYNPGSPFIALDDWDGVSCYGCGFSMPSDETQWCELCEEDFCTDCMSACNICDAALCRSCMKECPVCQEPICPACMTTCPDCGGKLCRTCLEDELCPCPKEENEDESDEGEVQPADGDGAEAERFGAPVAPATATSEDRAEVLADGVGQATLLS